MLRSTTFSPKVLLTPLISKINFGAIPVRLPKNGQFVEGALNKWLDQQEDLLDRMRREFTQTSTLRWAPGQRP